MTTITTNDVKQSYICIDCYAQHQQFLAGTPGIDDAVYYFATDLDGLEHLDDTNFPEHSLAIRIQRKGLDDYPPIEDDPEASIVAVNNDYVEAGQD